MKKFPKKFRYTNAAGNWNRENGGEQGHVFVFETRKVLVSLCLNFP